MDQASRIASPHVLLGPPRASLEILHSWLACHCPKHSFCQNESFRNLPQQSVAQIWGNPSPKDQIAFARRRFGKLLCSDLVGGCKKQINTVFTHPPIFFFGSKLRILEHITWVHCTNLSFCSLQMFLLVAFSTVSPFLHPSPWHGSSKALAKYSARSEQPASGVCGFVVWHFSSKLSRNCSFSSEDILL